MKSAILKCRECSNVIENKKTVVFEKGEPLHTYCLTQIKMQARKNESAARIRSSKELLSSSKQVLTSSRARLRSLGKGDERPVL